MVVQGGDRIRRTIFHLAHHLINPVPRRRSSLTGLSLWLVVALIAANPGVWSHAAVVSELSRAAGAGSRDLPEAISRVARAVARKSGEAPEIAARSCIRPPIESDPSGAVDPAASARAFAWAISCLLHPKLHNTPPPSVDCGPLRA